MKKSQGELKGRDQSFLLEEGRIKNTDGKIFIKSKNKSKALKKWYIVYMTTAISVVVAVVALLLFGVGNNNSSLIENIRQYNIADKIAEIIVGLNFFDMSSDNSDGVDTALQPLPRPEDTNTDSNGNKNEDLPNTDVGVAIKDIYDFDYSKVPTGHTPIIPMDLSLSSYGRGYINNSTGYTPDITSLINKNLKADNGYEHLSVSSSPIVLIIHTHGTEAYSPDGAVSCSNDEREYARTTDTDKNVVAIGKSIADILNQNGVPTAHCTIMHDSIQYKDSYARAEDTIKRYIEEYPTIKLVIDIHRDAIIKSSGEIVRPVAAIKGEAAAQVMCVVGSDWGGNECPNWENNLSLALKLREKLNNECSNICRPVNLKASTYNQELAPYSLLLEVGATGNSLNEAQRTANLIGETVSALIKEI